MPVEGSTPSSSTIRAGVAQTADAPSSEGGSCEFESHLPHQIFGNARVAQTGRGGSLKKSRVRVRLPPRASLARVAQAGRGSGLKHRQLRVQISPRASGLHAGAYANGQSGLIFNQAPEAALRVRVPPPLPTIFTLVVAQTGRAPRRERGRCGFESRRPTLTTRGVSQVRKGTRLSTAHTQVQIPHALPNFGTVAER